MNPLDQRPIIVAIAGPNGAGKSTFYEAHLRASGLRFVNADALARELEIDAYRAAELANRVRRDLVLAGESFVFETVFSDPEQEKVSFLRDAANAGYTVLLCFIGLESATLSDERVTLRNLMGGHDVPRDKLLARYPRSLANLGHAMRELPHVQVFDNSVENQPHRLLAVLERGALLQLHLPTPAWFLPLLRQRWPRNLLYVVKRVEPSAQRDTLELEARASSLFVSLRQPEDPLKVGDRVRFTPDLTPMRARPRALKPG